MPPLAAIIRSSDRVRERQRRGTYHGDEDQAAEINHYARTRGLEVVFLEPELDVSGGRPISERPSLREAIEGVERGIYSGIITANLKRLTRSRSGIEIWDRVEAAGGHVHCAAENLDTSTPNGRFVRDIHLAEAVREREEHADRHAKRREQTVKAGIWRPRQLPRGLQFQGPAVGGRYRGAARRLRHGPDADEVAASFRERRAGKPLVQLAFRLGMTPAGVRHMLSNRIYIGELRDGTFVNSDAVEPIIDLDTFLAVQRVETTRPARVREQPALLAGLVRCAGCGHTMSRASSGRNGRTDVYGCHSGRSDGRCPASATITLRLLDKHVETIALAALARMQTSSTTNDRDLQAGRAAVASAEAELATYLEAVSAAEIGAAAFAAGARARQAAVDDAHAQLVKAVNAAPIATVTGDVGELWRSLDTGQRNRLLRGLVEAVIVERAGGPGTFRPIDDRVRVIAHGAGLFEPYRGGGRPMPIRTIRLPDRDDPVTLRVDL